MTVAVKTKRSFEMITVCRAAMIAVASVSIIFSGCLRKAPGSDPTPPVITLVKWEKNAQGQQGTQTTIQPGGQFTISRSWLGYNKADIKIFADDVEGVRMLEVTGAAKGPCSTNANANGQFFNSPGSINASFPTQSETTSPGTVKEWIAFHLDDLMLSASCGTHIYNNMPAAQEFFLDAGTWTIKAKAENCCGGVTTATFTIIVQ